MKKLSHFLTRHSSKIVWLAIIIYGLVLAAVCLWKYNHFLYNALDLAIFNNVFYNTLHGHWFWSSIQGHSYLGDHFTPLLILLLPFYALWQSPETLLILQTLALALTAWPIYKISQLILKDNQLAVGLSLLWLINPLVHNINLFEFHFLSFLPLALLSLFYFYLKLKADFNKQNLFYFCLFLLLTLMLREDIALIILVFLGLILLANLKNKQLFRLTIYSLLFVIFWLALSLKIINLFSPSDFSPFVYYYHWLGQSSFLQIFNHLFSVANFEMLAGLLLPFLFIPLIKPKWLLIAIFPLAQIIFSATGGGALIWQMHYAALFLPAIFMAFIYSFKVANKFTHRYFNSRSALLIILLVINFYLWDSLGPFNLNHQPAAAKQTGELIKLIPPKATVLAGYNFLPNLSSRQNIYALNYFFLGHQQFGAGKYLLPHQPDYVIFNLSDLISFNVQLANLDWTKKYYHQGADRLRELLKNYGVVKMADDAVLFKKNYISHIKLLAIKPPSSNTNSRPAALINFNNQIELINFNKKLSRHGLELDLSFQALQPIPTDYQLEVSLADGQNNYKKILPLAYGLYPTSAWQDGEIIDINYWLALPDNFNIMPAKIKLNLVNLSGGVEMDKLGMTKLVIDNIKPIMLINPRSNTL